MTDLLRPNGKATITGYSVVSIAKRHACVAAWALLLTLTACGGDITPNNPSITAPVAPPAAPPPPVSPVAPSVPSTPNTPSTSTPTPTPTFTVGGTVAGMPGGVSLQLSNGSSDLVAISANGPFVFPTALASGAAYSVTVAVQPGGQTCVVTNGAGVVAASNVAAISVNCEQAEFALVPNRADGTTSVYRIDPSSGALGQVPGSPFPTGSQPTDIAVAGNVAYIAQPGSNTVQGFSINAATGALTPIDGGVAAGLSPESIVSDPSGKFVYVANAGSDTVTSFSIDPTSHALSAVDTEPAGSQPVALAVSLTGPSLYVADESSGFDFSFTTNTATGALTTALGTPFFECFQPFAIAVAPSGQYVYTVCNGGNDISMQNANPSTGQLGVSTTLAGVGASSITITPSGKFAYMGKIGSNTIQIYNVGATDGLFDPTTVQSVQISPGSEAVHVTVDPTGRWLYAPTAAGTVAAFTIDATSGALTAVPGNQAPAGNSPTTLAIARPVP